MKTFVDECVRGSDFFQPGTPVFVARAPGRLDVMGGIADYSGSLVLQMPIAEACLVAAQPVPDAGVCIRSVGGPGQETRELHIDGDQVEQLVRSPYAEARTYFQADPSHTWAAYVAGVLCVLGQEKGLAPGGWRLLVQSQVPEGKGVSSSAALEVATMQAVCAAKDLALADTELALLCQRVENQVVGAPCGIMDQMTSALGRSQELLVLLCQPATVEGFRPLPEGLRVWGVDSGLRHAVSGSDYTGVRAGAFMGVRILEEHLGPGAFGGYLANLDPGRFERELAQHLPEELEGAEFLRRYGSTPDPVTHVEPDRVYAVRQPTAHPVQEHARVRRFARLLEGNLDPSAKQELGRLMGESHRSYSACGLGTEGTDRLVHLVEEIGPAGGLYGARITGGGSGGTVAVLGDATAGEAVTQVARQYSQDTGRTAQMFSGSSAGAVAFGVVLVRTGPSRR